MATKSKPKGRKVILLGKPLWKFGAGKTSKILFRGKKYYRYRAETTSDVKGVAKSLTAAGYRVRLLRTVPGYMMVYTNPELPPSMSTA